MAKTYNKEIALEKKERKQKAKLKQKEKKEKNREKRMKEENKKAKDAGPQKSPTELYGHLSRDERRNKEKELSVFIETKNKPVVGKEIKKVDEPVLDTKPSRLHVVPIHYERSVPVTSWASIEDDALEMAQAIDNKLLKYENGYYHSGFCLALHHSQVSNKPLNFFVVNGTNQLEEVIKHLGSRFIVNPVVEPVPPEMSFPMKEGCVSFPNKSHKKVNRGFACTVEYQIPDNKEKGGLKKIKKQVGSVVAQMFQHECDHADGRNIYYQAPKA